MYTTSGLSNKKCNIMLFLDKSLCKIPKWCIAFIMFMNAHANFTWFCLKATSCVHPFISNPLFTIRFDYWWWGNALCWNPKLLDEFPHSTTMCWFPWSMHGWKGIWWHLNVYTCMPKGFNIWYMMGKKMEWKKLQ
jgi:hypothetical protein